MSLWLKILLGIAGAVAVVLLLLAALVTFILEPNDYRPLLVDAVQDATGREFAISGDLGLAVLPCCSVSVGPSRLGNPDGFEDADFARLEGASLSLKLWPLLTRRQLEIGVVTLEGLDVSLTRLADGRVNWLLEPAPQGSGAAAPADADTAAGGQPLDLAVEGVRITDSRVRYSDQQSGAAYEVSDIRIGTGAIDLGSGRGAAFPVEVSARLFDPGTDLEADLELSAHLDIGAEPPGERISVEQLNATVEVLESRLSVTGAGTLAGDSLDFAGDLTLAESNPRELLAALGEAPMTADEAVLRHLSARGQWRLSDTGASVEALVVRLDDSRLTGSAAVDDFERLSTRFDLAVDQLDVDRYLAPETASDGPAGTGSPSQATQIPLDALAQLPLAGRLHIDRLTASGIGFEDVALRIDSQSGTVETRLDAALAGGTLALTGGGRVAGSKPALGGTLSLESISPRALLAALDADTATANPAALSRLEGSAEWTLTPTELALAKQRWRFDDSRLTGSLRVTDFDAMAVRFNMRVDRMNLDDYLAPADPAAHTGANAPGPDSAATEIPVELLRPLDLRGALRAESLVIMGLTVTDVTAKLRAADGVLHFEPLSAAVYGGRYRGSAVVDATGTEARVTLDQRLRNVQASQILGDLLGMDALAGTLTLNLSGSGAGNTATELLRGLAGGVSFDLQDGVYRGMDLTHELKSAAARFRKEPAPADPEDPETPIQALNLQGEMQDGVLQTRALSAQTRGLRLAGSGGVNLVDLVLDYQIDAEVLAQAASAMGLEELTGLAVPLTLRGPVSAPRVAVDIRGLAGNALRATAERKLQQLLNDKLGDAEAEAPASDAEAADQTAEEPSTRDLLKQGLRDLLDSRRQQPEAADP